ncbi:MAG: CapA family protein [Parcubacteria group bacterium]
MKKDFRHIIILSIFSLFVGGALSYIILNSEGAFFVVNSVNAEDSELKQDTQDPQVISTGSLESLTKTLKNALNFRDKVSIGFVGDIVPGLNAPKEMLDGVAEFTKRPDIMIGNLEGVITQSQYSKCGVESKNCFTFAGDENFLRLLASASFDVLNTSNNHFNDFGNEGREDTVKKIKEQGIIPVGMKDDITYINKNNIKVGIVGFSTFWYANDLNNETDVVKNITEAEKNADIVVVIFHAGGEGVNYVHTPQETEWYLGENRGDVRLFAHKSIDAGADIVLGSGPHVLRGIETYKGKLIAYSLGNFASASNKILNTGKHKTSAMIEATLEKDGSFVSGKVYPLELNSYLEPYPDLENTAVDTINELSLSDFGSSGVLVEDSGNIILK